MGAMGAMFHKRVFQKAGMSLVLALSFLWFGAIQQDTRAADVYGLTIGVDDYLGTRNDLAGAVNDANDIAQALRGLGAKRVVQLLDFNASKQNIANAWRDLVNEAKAGDTIVFTFSGHGSQEREPAGRGGESDGLNENFLLSQYQPNGPGSAERIVDDEIFMWLKMADDKGIKVIFVADSCHSGTMHRAVRGTQKITYRKGNYRALDQALDALDYPDISYARFTENDLKYMTFIGATSDNRLTPEVYIDNEVRGALSWSFARALEGFADRNKDGMTSQLELLGYIIPTVKAQVENQQTPHIAPLRSASLQLLPARKQTLTNIITGAIGFGRTRQGEFGDLQVFVNGAPPDLQTIDAVQLVQDKVQADIIWDRETNTISHRVGGVVAENVTPETAQHVISKWSAINLLKSKMQLSPVRMSLPNGDKRYAKGELVTVEVEDVRYPYLTLFNLPPDGKVEFFLPNPNRPDDAQKSWLDKIYRQQFRVSNPPFGAEHLVAIYSEEVLSDLHSALALMKTPTEAKALRGVLQEALKGRTYQVGVLGIYTGQ